MNAFLRPPRDPAAVLEELLEAVRELLAAERDGRPWSEADLLTEAEAVARLRRRSVEGRSWLSGHVPARMVAGEPRWIWGDVLAVLRGEGATLRRQPEQPKVKLPSAGTWPRGGKG